MAENKSKKLDDSSSRSWVSESGSRKLDSLSEIGTKSSPLKDEACDPIRSKCTVESIPCDRQSCEVKHSKEYSESKVKRAYNPSPKGEKPTHNVGINARPDIVGSDLEYKRSSVLFKRGEVACTIKERKNPQVNLQGESSTPSPQPDKQRAQSPPDIGRTGKTYEERRESFKQEILKKDPKDPFKRGVIKRDSFFNSITRLGKPGTSQPQGIIKSVESISKDVKSEAISLKSVDCLTASEVTISQDEESKITPSIAGKILVNRKQESCMSDEVLKNVRVIALYFAASWSKNCKKWPSVLKTLKQIAVKYNVALEIIFISSDNSQSKFWKHFMEDHGDWWAAPYESELAICLRYEFCVSSVPHLVIMRPNGEIISRRAVQELEAKDPEEVLLSWLPHLRMKALPPPPSAYDPPEPKRCCHPRTSPSRKA